ncbi:LmbU family transcriptional regulator [Dactylosporangium vinaceum]|uniref:LmbU family transcriptional regulator n=1 Tax=Dactylosporangium vinaceum TaxID=53362 RepID=A0ABV5MCN2_9ACTN|nr:LmbU family transcriptional regulator [Dactylosporangium vinaceum]UAC00966.1 LmbU family transcriptional regulator [Dactylosporangium vinaceum]
MNIDAGIRDHAPTGAEAASAMDPAPPAGPARTRMTRVGLRISHELSFEMWEQCGRRLSEVVDSSAWCLGDWLVYGKSRFPDRYELAIRAAGLQYQTLRNYSWVSRRFPLERRRERLSFQHHAEIASLPASEQDWWLDQAERSHWTTKQLRARIKDYVGALDAKPEPDPEPEPTEVMPRIRVESGKIDGWRQAAEFCGVQFESWVAWALDQAAARTARPGPGVLTRSAG